MVEERRDDVMVCKEGGGAVRWRVRQIGHICERANILVGNNATRKSCRSANLIILRTLVMLPLMLRGNKAQRRVQSFGAYVNDYLCV